MPQVKDRHHGERAPSTPVSVSSPKTYSDESAANRIRKSGSPGQRRKPLSLEGGSGAHPGKKDLGMRGGVGSRSVGC